MTDNKTTAAIVLAVLAAIAAAAVYFIWNSRKDEGANPSGQPAPTTPASTPAPAPQASVTWELVKEPVYAYYSCATVQEPNKMCPQLTMYYWYIVMRAKGFKPNTDLTFAIDERSYSKYTNQGALYPPTVIVKSDASGNAEFKQKVYSGISEPTSDYFPVGAFVTVSDGVTSVGPVQVHYNYRYAPSAPTTALTTTTPLPSSNSTTTTTTTNTSSSAPQYPVSPNSAPSAILQAFKDAGYFAQLSSTYQALATSDPKAWLIGHPYLYSTYPKYFVGA